MKNKNQYIASFMSAVMLFSFNGALINADSLDLTNSHFIFADEKEPTKDVGAFVNRCYEVALGREADSEGYNYWVDLLNNGKACGAQVGYGFIFSNEYTDKNTDNSQFVKDLYKMYFDREPDEAGYNYWLDMLNTEVPREKVFEGFANSLEFFNLCDSYGVVAGTYIPGMPSDQQGGINCFVARLYKACLNRLPDQAGQSGWVSKLADKAVTGTEVAKGFVLSEELVNRNLSNEEYVKVMYDAFFGREADSEGLSAWVEKLNAGVSKNMIFNGFTKSAEFDNLCNSYGIECGAFTEENSQNTDEMTALEKNNNIVDYFRYNIINNPDNDLNRTYYYDKDKYSYLEVCLVDDSSINFHYTTDPVSLFDSMDFSLCYNNDSDLINAFIDFEYINKNHAAWITPIMISCEEEYLSEIVAHAANPDYVLSNGSLVSFYTTYSDAFKLADYPTLQNDINLTYACFSKNFEEALKYWGTSKEALGIDFGNALADYPTEGTTSFNHSNNFVKHTFASGKATDADLSWYDFICYACKYYNDLNDVYTDYVEYNAPYYINSEILHDVFISDEGDKLRFYYVEYGYDGDYSLNIDIIMMKDSDDISVDVYKWKAIEEDKVDDYLLTFTCKKSEFGKVCSSIETIKANDSVYMYNNGNLMENDDLIKEFLSKYDTIFDAYENALSFIGTSFMDGGLIYKES